MWSGGNRYPQVTDTETVDADGSYLSRIPGGDLKGAVANQLRFGGFSDGTRRFGALLEVASENTCLNSEVMRAAISAWANGDATVTDDVIAAPNGTITADKIIEANGLNTVHGIAQSGVSFVSGTTYCFSIFGKAAERSEIRMLFVSGTAFPGAPNVWYDLAAGSKGTVDANVDDSGIDDFGGGWFRCWFTATADATAADTPAIRLGIATEDNTYDGDGSSGVYLWGAQVEALKYPTSYIKTEGSSVTRSGDSLRYANVGDMNAAPEAITIYLAFTPAADGADFKSVSSGLIDTRNLGNNDGVGIVYFQSQNGYRVLVRSGSSSVADVFGTGSAPAVRGVTNVIAVAITVNDCRLYVDAVSQGIPSTSMAAPTAMDIIRIERIGALQPEGMISHVHIYGTAHTAARIRANSNEIRNMLGLHPS